MTIRDGILGVLRATGPVASVEIARVLGVSTQSVASHLGYMAKDGLVARRGVPVGQRGQGGPFTFQSEGFVTLWFIPRTVRVGEFAKIRHDARVHKRLPRAILPPFPVPHTDDMIQMLDDIAGVSA